MASFRRLVERNLGAFPHFVLYVILEWLIIILLFADGIIAFVCNEITRFFDLRVPCLLCTRIDHLLVHRNSQFYYNDSICEAHKMEVYTLAYCHVHKKLTDIRSMCKGCLLSFAMEKEPNFHKYKSFDAGILHKDADCFAEDERRMSLLKPLKKGQTDILPDEKGGILRCNCCGDPVKTKLSTECLTLNAPAPSPRTPVVGGRNKEGRNSDLPHIRFSEPKLLSDTESEVVEDEDALKVDNRGKEDPKTATKPSLPDSEEVNKDISRTPTFTRGNKFFGIPLSDSDQASPRWANQVSSRKLPVDKFDFISDPNEDPNEEASDDDDLLTRLKRQVRSDRKTLLTLSMELDEERSASAVAAKNAMAMITRLQADKAAVQMEALQYQRMMEEQAEYDQEAMQHMKDLLFKREEDIRSLEFDLEEFREKYGHINKLESEVCEIDDEDYQDMKLQGFSYYSEKSDGASSTGADQTEGERMYDRSMEDKGRILDGAYFDFEKERSYLLGLLRNLEEKISSELDERSRSPEVVVVNNDNEETDAVVGNENKVILTREVSLIRERLREIEADIDFLKHAAMTLQRGEEGTKLLTEIAQLLRKLRQPPVKSPSEDN